MAQINWGLANQNGFQNALAMGVNVGNAMREQREEKEYRNALAQYDPSNPETLKPVAQVAPELGMQLRQQQAQQQAAADERAQGQIPMAIRLLESSTDEASYQRNRQVAQQYGFDLSRLPEQFGDGAWRDEQIATLKMFGSPEGQKALSGFGKQAQDLGFQPGTPEYEQAVRELIIADSAIPYTGGMGETRLYRPEINIPNAQQQQQRIIPDRPQGLSDDDLMRSAREAVEQGADVNEVFQQLKAWGVQI